MTSQSGHNDAQVPPPQHFWTVESGDLRRFATLATRQALLKPPFILAALLLALVVVVGVVQQEGSTGLVVGAALTLIIIAPVIWWSTYRSGRVTMAPGASWSSGFNDDGMMITNPDGTIMLTWDSVTAVEPKGFIVLVRTKARRGGIGIPAPLFPPESVEFARKHLV